MTKKVWRLVNWCHPKNEDEASIEPWFEIYELRKGVKKVERRIYEENGEECDLKFYELVSKEPVEDWEEIESLAELYLETRAEAEEIAQAWLEEE